MVEAESVIVVSGLAGAERDWSVAGKADMTFSMLKVVDEDMSEGDFSVTEMVSLQEVVDGDWSVPAKSTLGASLLEVVDEDMSKGVSVSYTHLTLPTKA